MSCDNNADFVAFLHDAQIGLDARCEETAVRIAQLEGMLDALIQVTIQQRDARLLLEDLQSKPVCHADLYEVRFETPYCSRVYCHVDLPSALYAYNDLLARWPDLKAPKRHDAKFERPNAQVQQLVCNEQRDCFVALLTVRFDSPGPGSAMPAAR